MTEWHGEGRERRSCVTGKEEQWNSQERREERKRARGRRPPDKYPRTAWPRTTRRSSPRRNEWSKVSDTNIFLIIDIREWVYRYMRSVRYHLGCVRTCQCTRDLDVRVRGPAASSFPATSVGTSVYSRYFCTLVYIFLPIVLSYTIKTILIYPTITNPSNENVITSWRFEKRTTK